MLAWAHFLLTELRPLYAILFATSLYAESKTLQVGIWGNKKSTCWVNQIYKNCAERCGHVWHGQRCNCDSGAFRACEDNYNGLSEPQPVFIMDDSHLTSILNESSAFPSYARGHYAPYETVYYHYALFSLTLAIFVLANVLFLKFVGFSSKLDGRYVRFCLEIEHRHNFRKALKAYSLIIVVVIAAGWYTFWQLSSITPGQRDILELLLIAISCKAMLVTEHKHIIDIEDDEFDEVQFNLVPMFYHGVDASVGDLSRALVLKEYDAEYFEKKAKIYLKGSAAGLKLKK